MRCLIKLNGRENETKLVDLKETDQRLAVLMMLMSRWHESWERKSAGIRWDVKDFGGGVVLRSMCVSYFLHQLEVPGGQGLIYIVVPLRIRCIIRVLTLCLSFDYTCCHGALKDTLDHVNSSEYQKGEEVSSF